MKLPAGLTDKGVEFFVDHDKIKATYDGKIVFLSELPEEILEHIRSYMLTKPLALKALNEMNIINDMPMIEQFIKCNFGGYDFTPDISTDKEIKSEYWDCGKRGYCNYEGKLCGGIKVVNGVLSQREIDVIKLISKGKLDKEIADELNISISTVSSHKQNIQEKTGLQTKTEIAVFAIHKNLISC